jgi:hypothetical protein
MKEFYTVTEFATLTCLSSNCVREHLRNGSIEGKKVFKKWIIHKSVVDKILGTKL